VQKTADELLPSTITTGFQGSAQAFQDSLQGLGLILGLVVFLGAHVFVSLRAQRAFSLQEKPLR
jgi:HAE1 family hydrophobic/amphiphilic exporter-1